MSSIALRPRSATELVDAAIQVYKRQPLSFILAIALIYVPWLFVRVAFGIGLDDNPIPTPTQTIVTAFGVIVVYAIAGGVTTVMASDVYLDKPVDLARAFRTVGARVAPLITTMIIVTIALGLGFALFLLPALYPLARFFAVRQTILLEDVGSVAALRRSSELSLGSKRHILNTLLLVGVIFLAISIGALLLTGMIPNRLLRETLNTAISVLVYPAFGITETLLYYDLRIRKEGFDVEYLAAQASAGAVGATSSTAAL
jgi:hypothetical protein